MQTTKSKKPHFITAEEMNACRTTRELFDLFEKKGIKMRGFSGYLLSLDAYVTERVLLDIMPPFTKFELPIERKLVICQ